MDHLPALICFGFGFDLGFGFSFWVWFLTSENIYNVVNFKESFCQKNASEMVYP